MDIKTGLLMFTLLIGCIAVPAHPKPKDGPSSVFNDEDISFRIVGGTEAPIGSHPHLVALTAGNRVKSLTCGGSLITQRTILTAGHCICMNFFNGALVSSLRAIVGTNRWKSGGYWYSISYNLTHPYYVDTASKNDIGLLITSYDVALSNLVRTVPLTYEYIPQGVRARVAGWGRTSIEDLSSPVLLEYFPTTIEESECAARVTEISIQDNVSRYVDSDIEVCAFNQAGSATCHGDSGGAITRVDNGQQFGVVSWGIPCARGAPDMFVRISYNQNWLQYNVV